MKKILTGILCLILLVNVASFGLAQQDTSIEIKDFYGHWAEDTITEWINKGLIEGYDDGTFKPNNNISKVEFIILVNRIYGYYVETNDKYTDISESIWFSKDCKIAKANGYMDWYKENELNPKESILREEVFAILALIMQLEPSDDLSGIDKFSDKDQISDWSKNYLDALITAGYIEGNGDGTLEPKENITRAEAVIMIDRVMGDLINEAGTYGSDIDTEVQTIENNLTVNTSDVDIHNMIIKGDLILAAGIANGDVDLSNVTINGRTIINGGGENSITITGSNLGEVRVYKADGKIRVVLVGSEAESLILQSGGKLEGEYGDTAVIINTEDGQEVILDGVFENVEVDSEMNIQVNDGSSIDEITFNAEATVTGKGTIRTAKVNVDGVNVEQKVDRKISKDGTDSSGVKEKIKYIPSNRNDITSTIIGILDGDMNVIDVFYGTTVSELKAAINVSSRARFDILDGDISAIDSAEVTDSMEIKVTAENGEIAQYTIAMTDGTDILHPIHIYTEEQLDEVRNNLSLNYKVEANINLTSYIADNYDDDDTVDGIQGGWEPIGISSELFTGTFNGGNYIISNLTINRDEHYQGLFGCTSSTSIIENVQLENLSVVSTSGRYIAGLVGENRGTITSVSETGNVTGEDYVGSLVGLNSGTITSSNASVVVTGNAEIGGLVGSNNDSGTITNSYATRSVNGNGNVGGLVGSNTGRITNSYANGSVTGNGDVGGLVGDNNDGTILSSYATGIVSGNNYIGGLIGDNQTGTLTDNYASGNVTGNIYVGGLIGFNFSGPIISSNASGDVRGDEKIGGLVGLNFGVGIITSSSATGNVSENVTGIGYTGGLVGFNDINGEITNSNATGTITGTSIVGGMVGYNAGEITSSNATGTINGTSRVGGIVGDNRGEITNSYTTGITTGTNEVGGMAGHNAGEITKSYTFGNIEGTSKVGGMVGSNGTEGIITNSYTTGTVTGTSEVGGMTGYNGGSITNTYATGSVIGSTSLGGMVGFCKGSITNSYALNDSIVTVDVAAGYERLVGYNVGGTITNCYANSSMTINGSTVSDLNSDSIKGADLSETDAMLQSTYTDNAWDFVTIWQIDGGNSYPTFIWQAVE